MSWWLRKMKVGGWWALRAQVEAIQHREALCTRTTLGHAGEGPSSRTALVRTTSLSFWPFQNYVYIRFRRTTNRAEFDDY
jgi:hypothetical protein